MTQHAKSARHTLFWSVRVLKKFSFEFQLEKYFTVGYGTENGIVSYKIDFIENFTHINLLTGLLALQKFMVKFLNFKETKYFKDQLLGHLTGVRSLQEFKLSFVVTKSTFSWISIWLSTLSQVSFRHQRIFQNQTRWK